MACWAALSSWPAGRLHSWLQLPRRLSELKRLPSHWKPGYSCWFRPGDCRSVDVSPEIKHLRGETGWDKQDIFDWQSIPPSLPLRGICVKYWITFVFAVWSLSTLSRTLQQFFGALVTCNTESWRKVKAAPLQNVYHVKLFILRTLYKVTWCFPRATGRLSPTNTAWKVNYHRITQTTLQI